MSNKVFIIYHNQNIINEIINELYETSSDINISNKFTTEKNDAVNSFPYSYYYINQLEVNKALKNNSVLYIITNDYVSTGITIDDFYNNDVFCMNYKEYNAIPDIIFNKYNILTVWVDSKQSSYDQSILSEIPFVEKRLERVNYNYYFNDKNSDIIKDIINFIQEI